MTTPLRLGIAGLGTVGTGVVRIIQNHADLLAARTGRTITISAVSARSKGKDRGVKLDAYAWEDDPVALARRDDVDVFVEVMGGSDGPAKLSTEAAIAAGKDIVTANKALLALHGQELAEAAEAKGLLIRFEAAVAGGIPAIKALTEGLAGNEITRVMGVMNGTCNYILTRMESAGLPYETVSRKRGRWAILRPIPIWTWAGSMRGTSCRSCPPSPLVPGSILPTSILKGLARFPSRISGRPPTWASRSSFWAWHR